MIVRVLFVTRRYPPSIGGMQTLSYQLARELSRRADVSLLTWGGSQAFLPYFVAASFIRAIPILRSGRAEHVHLGDALLAPLGVALGRFTGATTTATVNGRDIAFDLRPYQMIIPRALGRLDRVICVSDAIADECVRRGVPSEKCVVVPNGVDPEEFRAPVAKERLAPILGRDLAGVKVLATVGRLVPKKGVRWFVANVMPELPPHVIYIVVGDGPEREAIEQAIEREGLSGRVILLGAIPREDERLRTIYGCADAFVMPNQAVRGDMEGFGIVAAEASSAGVPVIAARLEGLQDAVIEGETGRLVDPGSPSAFVNVVHEVLDGVGWSRTEVQAAAERAFSWERVGAAYLREFEAAHAARVS